MNTNITSLQAAILALENNDFVTNISPIMENGIEIGYVIQFSKSGNITIYHGIDGKEGAAPVIGVKKTDGKLYWTVNGDWLFDSNGEKVPTTGTPALKIENEYWYVSHDDGKSWTQLYKAVGEDGQDGDAFFQDVVIDDEKVTLVLADGHTFEIPIYRKVSISFNITENKTTIRAGETITLSYTLENASDSTIVTAASDGNYIVKVIPADQYSGVIEVKCPEVYTDGYINVTAADNNGYTFIQVISFRERTLYLSSGFDYSISYEGGLISIPMELNFGYSVRIPAEYESWISTVQTKVPTRYETLELYISQNNAPAVRQGYIEIYAENNENEAYCQINILQASAIFEQQETILVANAVGDTLTTNVRASAGLAFKNDELPEWISVSLETEEDETSYIVSFIITENNEAQKRISDVHFYSADRQTRMGSITIIQMESDATNNLTDLIFKVRANYANDFTARLPIPPVYSNDFIVDWGDGNIERFPYGEKRYNELTHKYNGLTEGTTFEVKVSGTVWKLYCEYIDNSITEVVQWGNTGLEEMHYAFKNHKALTSIPTDNAYAFANISNLSSTFSGCSSLSSIGEGIFEHCKRNITSAERCFENCTSLETLPDGLFEGFEKTINFTYCFYGCVSLKELPEGMFKNCTNAENFSHSFFGCRSLEYLPERMFENCINIKNFFYCFLSCESLKSIPEGLFNDSVNVSNFNRCFSQCSSLEEVPVSLFDNNRKVTDFEATFALCREWVGESPYTEIDGVKYHLYERADAPDHFVTPDRFESCFSSCKNLTDYQMIPHMWL